MRNLLKVTLLATLAILAIGCMGSERFEKYRQALDGANVSLSDAIATALAELPDGRVVEAELDPDGDPLFEVEMWVNGGAQEVRIDPQSGEVLEIATINESYSGCATIAFADAVVLAEGHISGGEAVAIRQEGCELEVHVADQGALWEIELDANGRFLEKEEADDDDEEWD